MMDLKPFKQDIDELIHEFAEGESTTLDDMKKVWLSRKFSFIFEASPTTNQAFFMQSLYSHSIGYMVSTDSLSHRLGGLYCLYCLHETQPFKPPFKIYLSLGELKKLKHLVLDSKYRGVSIVCALVKSMLDRNLFFFGCVDMNYGNLTAKVNELTDMQNARVQYMNKKLFDDTRIEHYIHMDMGTELEVDLLKKMSTDYAVAKDVAIKESGKVVDVQDIKHIAENQTLIGDEVEKSVEGWNVQKEQFYQQTGLSRPEKSLRIGTSTSNQRENNKKLQLLEFNRDSMVGGHENPKEQGDNGNLENDEEFGAELEHLLTYEEFETQEDENNTQLEEDDLQ